MTQPDKHDSSAETFAGKEIDKTEVEAPKATAKQGVARKTAKKKAAKKTAKKSSAKKAAGKRVSAPKTRKKKPVPAPGTTMTEALGETFLVDLITDWQEHGGGVIETCRTTKPDAYLKLVATYAPKEFRKTLEPFEGMNDNDLKARLNETLEEIRTLGLDLGT